MCKVCGDNVVEGELFNVGNTASGGTFKGRKLSWCAGLNVAESDDRQKDSLSARKTDDDTQ